MRMERNALLRKLTDEDFAQFAPACTLVELKKGDVLLKEATPVENVYFPLDCVCSILAVTDSDHPIEAGMFGAEGMSNMVVREGDYTFFRSTVFIEGSALRVPAPIFARLLTELPSLNELTLRYKDFAAVQFGYGCYAHGAFPIEARLARWLLMAADRAPNPTLPIIHDLVASMLSVRRSGITNAMHILEGSYAIKATRGLVTILDRAKLEQLAGDCYGPAERAYRLIMDRQPDQR